MGRTLITLCALLWAVAIPAEVSIHSSHIAQMIYPEETLTLTVSGLSPEVNQVNARVLTDDGSPVSETSLSVVEGEVRQDIDGLAVGLYLYHVHTSRDADPIAFTRIAVVPRPDSQNTAENSVVGVDAWLAWRFRGEPEQVRRDAELMRKMGIFWVRDRLSWAEVQPTPPPEFNPSTMEMMRDWPFPETWEWDWYDTVYGIEAEAGLKVVPVFHDVAPWASATGETEPALQPTDLHALQTFARHAGERWRDVIAGIEIGNEVNSPIFFRGGSHEAAAYVKAAATGFAQGAPNLWRLLSSTTDALDQPPHQADAAGLVANNALAFVDAVAPHHYGPLHGLRHHVEWWGEHASSESIWMTEFGSTAIPQVGPTVGVEERRQAEYLVEAHRRALAAGADRTFYFCLMDFHEHGERPFGLVEAHGDHWVPRLGLVELAKLAAEPCGDEVEMTRNEPGPLFWVAPNGESGEREPMSYFVASEPIQSGGAIPSEWGSPWTADVVTRAWGLRLIRNARFSDHYMIETALTPPISITRPSLIIMEGCDALTSMFTVTNNTEATREVTVQWDDETTVRISDPIPFTLGPGESDTFGMGTGVFNDPAPEELPESTLRWESEGQSGEGWAVPQFAAIAPRGERVITLDGDGRDWGGVWPWTLDETNTVVGVPPVGRASLKALWDDEALWLFAWIEDGQLMSPNPIEEPWAGDALEIFLDLNPSSARGQAMNDQVFQLIAIPSGTPGVPPGHHVSFSRPATANAASVEVGLTRYAGTSVPRPPGLELRIPWAVLGLEGPPADGKIGFDWGVDDLDDDAPTRSQRVWQGSMENWRDPSGYAELILVGARETPDSL